MFRSRALRLPALLLGPTLTLTIAATSHPILFEALRRDPSALRDGELWRLLSPVLAGALAAAWFSHSVPLPDRLR